LDSLVAVVVPFSVGLASGRADRLVMRFKQAQIFDEESVICQGMSNVQNPPSLELAL
jgi:hypothetical protein